MKIFTDEFVVSKRRHNPPIARRRFLYSPSTENFGSDAIAINIRLDGIKLEIKMAEITTTTF